MLDVGNIVGKFSWAILVKSHLEMPGKWNFLTCWKYCFVPKNLVRQKRQDIRDPKRLPWIIFFLRRFIDFLSPKSTPGIHWRRILLYKKTVSFPKKIPCTDLFSSVTQVIIFVGIFLTDYPWLALGGVGPQGWRIFFLLAPDDCPCMRIKTLWQFLVKTVTRYIYGHF